MTKKTTTSKTAAPNPTASHARAKTTKTVAKGKGDAAPRLSSADEKALDAAWAAEAPKNKKYGM